MGKKLFSLLAITAVLLTGCTLAPKYTRPEGPVPATWPSGPAYDNAHVSPGAPPAAEVQWREYFTDERLRQVIETALNNNRDLRVAALNVERARAMYGIQRAELLPSVSGNASMVKQHLPADILGTGTSMTVTQYDVNLGIASWEIDFFGRIRSLADAAREQYLATEQARRSAQILLVSGVANAWLALAADREHLGLAETTLETQKGVLALVKRRFERGVVPELDVLRAQAQVDAARGDVARFTQFVAQDGNALDLMAGAPVPKDLLPADLGLVRPPRDISPGVSSEVLVRRPDILQAESLLKAANANIGAARAAFFPRISLTAAFGTASAELDGLFEPGSGAWNFMPRIVMPVFDARTWSAAKVSEKDREIAIARYERAIQVAFREVSDALAVRGTVDQQLSAQQSLVRAVEETHRLSNARYSRGIDSYLEVLDAQRSLYAARQGLVSLRLARIANQVALYGILGGGWQPAGNPEEDQKKAK